MLMVQNELNSSLERPNLTLQGSFKKVACRASKFFQASPSSWCLKFPSLVNLVTFHLATVVVLVHKHYFKTAL